MYFETADRDIRALPKLEVCVHVNIALIVKFIQNYFFNPADDLPVIGRRDEAANDDFLFDQGPTRGLGKIRFGDWSEVFGRFDQPNVALFTEQAEGFKAMLAAEPPNAEQTKDTDWLLAVGEMFTLIVYAQLVLENAEIYDIDPDLTDEIFDVYVRDFSRFATQLHTNAATTPEQGTHALELIRKPVADPARYQRVRETHVHAKRDTCEMNP